MPGDETVEPVPVTALRPGDVLLMLGTAPSSRLIALVDGGDYSHSAIFDGENVLGCVAEGVVSQPIGQFMTEDDLVYLDAWRHVSAEGAALGDPGQPAAPVLARARDYLDAHVPYALHDLYLMGLLTVIRRLPSSEVERELIWLAINGLAAVADLVDPDRRRGMTCSEYVYRCFTEAGYGIPIAGAFSLPSDDDPLRTKALQVLARHDPALAQAAKHWDPSAVVPEFVSPHDLQTSPALRRIGRLRG